MVELRQELIESVEASLGSDSVHFDSQQSVTLEPSVSFRWHGVLGVQLVYDTRDPYVFTLIWSLTERRCPTGYRSADGRLVKIYVQEALKCLGIPCGEFTAEMLRLRGSSSRLRPMLDLSLNLLKQHQGNLLAGATKVFPQPPG